MSEGEFTRVFGAPGDGPQRPSGPVGASPAPTVPADAPHAPNRLPIGTRFGEYEIVDVVGEGGFGIVYLAYDHALEYRMAIKEYMPSSLAYRASDQRVFVKSEQMRAAFEAGLRSFVTEAKLLAHFNHASLLKAFRLWEAHGTAYMAMRFYAGITLKEALARLGGPPTQAWLESLLAPLLDAVETMHAENVYHRDIAPDNILIEPDGRPVLLDFGAARRVIGDLSPAVTVIYKPGFAPLEQSAPSAVLPQGPWTDVYAFSAVVHYALCGRTPPPSASRGHGDTLVPASTLGDGRYSARFLAAIDAGLAVLPKDRPQSIAAFREALGLPRGPAAPPAGPQSHGTPSPHGQPAAHDRRAPPALPPTEVWPPPEPVPPHADMGGSHGGGGSRGSGESPGFGASPEPGPPGDPLEALGRALREKPPMSPVGPGRPPSPEGGTTIDPVDLPVDPRRRWLAGAALAAAAVALAGGGTLWYTNSQRGAPTPGPDESRRDPAPPPAPPPEAPPPAPPAPPAPAFSPLAWLELVERGAAADRVVRASVPQRAVRIGREIRFGIRSERDGHLVVLLLGTDPSHFYQIFPNAFDRDTRIRAGEEVTLGRTPRGGRAWSLAAGGPNPGTNRFVAIVSDQPRDFADLGLVRNDAFHEFDQAVMRRRWEEAPDPIAIVAGRPVCAPGATCDAAYGAVRFDIEEIAR